MKERPERKIKTWPCRYCKLEVEYRIPIHTWDGYHQDEELICIECFRKKIGLTELEKKFNSLSATLDIPPSDPYSFDER